MQHGFPTIAQALLAAGLLLAVATASGWKAAAWLLAGRAECRLLAPLVGLALHSLVSLGGCLAFGVSAATVGACMALSLAVGLLPPQAWWAGDARPIGRMGGQAPWFVLVAAVVAVVPILPVLPQLTTEAAGLAMPIYDHAKVAIIDEIVRSGIVPPANPYYGGPEVGGRLTYYWLPYLVAAQPRVLIGVPGWACEIALSWLVAYGAILLTGALAVTISGRLRAAWWVLPVVLSGTLQIGLAQIDANFFTHILRLTGNMMPLTEQISWVPQHVLGAALAVLAMMSLVRLVREPIFRPAGVLSSAMFAAAAFASSAWVGGVTLAMMLAIVLPVVVIADRRTIRLAAALPALALSGALAILFAWPFLANQLGAMEGRELPIRLSAFRVFSEFGNRTITRIADVPGFWLVQVPSELTSSYVCAAIGLWLLRPGSDSRDDARLWLTSLAAIVTCLLIVQWLKSTLGNNDLGWRAVVPALLLMTGWAAAGFEAALRDVRHSRKVLAAIMVVVCFAALPGGLVPTAVAGTRLLRGETPTAPEIAFRSAPDLWAAVRRHAAPDERVLNDPAFYDGMTRWRGNIGWALLSDRRSCAAAANWLWTHALMPSERAEAAMLPVERFFAGTADADDVAYLRERLKCRIVVTTSRDRIWAQGPRPAIPGLVLLEETSQWRIHRWSR